MSWKTNTSTGKKFQSKGRGIDADTFNNLASQDKGRMPKTVREPKLNLNLFYIYDVDDGLQGFVENAGKLRLMADDGKLKKSYHGGWSIGRHTGHRWAIRGKDAIRQGTDLRHDVDVYKIRKLLFLENESSYQKVIEELGLYDNKEYRWPVTERNKEGTSYFRYPFVSTSNNDRHGDYWLGVGLLELLPTGQLPERLTRRLKQALEMTIEEAKRTDDQNWEKLGSQSHFKLNDS